jgi:hypothetical protein
MFIRGINVMIDIETLGTSYNALITSIGAVKFDCEKIVSSFYVNIDISSTTKYKFDTDKDSIKFWRQENLFEARKCLSIEPKDIKEALQSFNDWFGKISMPVWGNGVFFDNVILDNTYRKVGLEKPWMFYHDRCFRTIKSILPALQNDIPFDGIKHFALDDAKHEAMMLIALQQKFDKSKEK